MNITELKGIGAKTAENFNRLSVYTVSDLVGLYPRDYDVYHEPVFVKDISHESEHTEVAVEGQVCKSPDIYGSGRLKILTVTIKDYNGDSIKCSWYNMDWIYLSTFSWLYFFSNFFTLGKGAVNCIAFLICRMKNATMQITLNG